MIDLWADRLWSGELGIDLQKCIKTGVCVTVLLVDAGFPLLAVTESALHHLVIIDTCKHPKKDPGVNL